MDLGKVSNWISIQIPEDQCEQLEASEEFAKISVSCLRFLGKKTRCWCETNQNISLRAGVFPFSEYSQHFAFQTTLHFETVQM